MTDERIGSISVVLPAHNEEGNIEAVALRANQVLPTVAQRYEILIVDDGSRDRTGAIADGMAAENPNIKVIHHPRNRGYGHAWRSGIEAASGEWIFFMDSDRQFDIGDIGLLTVPSDPYEIVTGYRISRNDPYYRFLVGSCFNVLVKLLFNVHLRDIDCGFKMFRAPLLKSMVLESPGALINTEIHAKANLVNARTLEVGINHYPRTVGRQSGTKPKVMLRALSEIIRLRLHLVGYSPVPAGTNSGGETLPQTEPTQTPH
jgi:glycosyltransferase involved in cell wall biosynthesis